MDFVHHAAMKHYLLTLALVTPLVGLSACTPPINAQQDVFFKNLSRLCGNAYAGKLISDDAVDADFKEKSMVMHVSACTESEIRIPFHVGENRSRTWIITRTADGLRLKHDHRHEDSREDAVTLYGGDTQDAGLASRQEFPVDEYSIAMFKDEGLAASVTNVWAVEVLPEAFVYEMAREGRLFRVAFNTSETVPAPPPAW